MYNRGKAFKSDNWQAEMKGEKLMGVIQKYGGTSVENVEKIKQVAARIINAKQAKGDVVVVVSAMGKTTDKLVSLAKEIMSEPKGRELDVLMATGEQQSIALLAMALEAQGYPAISFTGFQAGIKTKGAYTKNKIDCIENQAIKKWLKEGYIVVVAGFQGINAHGDITTLGRGGSDTTAVALAASLGFECEIYTDVSGIFSVDPRVYPKAKQLTHISYEEMMEMASLGATVMETRAVEIGKKFGVPIYVASAHGNEKGTYIQEVSEMEEKMITGLSLNKDILMVTVQHVPHDPQHIACIFDQLAHKNINVDMISQTAPYEKKVNISFTCPLSESTSVNDALMAMGKRLPTVEIIKNDKLAKFSVVGVGMMNQSGVAASMFNLFAENNIYFEQVTTSEISISYTVEQSDCMRLADLVAKHFEL